MTPRFRFPPLRFVGSQQGCLCRPRFPPHLEECPIHPRCLHFHSQSHLADCHFQCLSLPGGSQTRCHFHLGGSPEGIRLEGGKGYHRWGLQQGMDV